MIISPQSWGDMFLSKHHYAIELARIDNWVYFLNPPLRVKSVSLERITIRQSVQHPNLFIIQHCLRFPYRLKFYYKSLFHWLMKFHVGKILQKIPQSVDIIWSFDLGNLYPFNLFPGSSVKIFHPVDEPRNNEAIDSAVGAHVMFSVTKEILEKYVRFHIPKFLINHGLGTEFLTRTDPKRPSGKVRVGYSGNLLLDYIDREILLLIIDDNPSVIFDFWGAYELTNNNIGGTMDCSTTLFIRALKARKNVFLHGAILLNLLSEALHTVDAFLICYDVQKEQSKGTNCHKVMEFFSTGKVTISSNLSSYAERPDLVVMVAERTDNKQLSRLFKEVILNLEVYNSDALKANRITFAHDNTYAKQINRIEKIMLRQ